ncbi:hypothetical protein FKP32DRAFT_1600495 [Trametes sanguinea]|nr:hypothetical protein FKP32DRAFT_1600495 [Trametes sanguinea]
MAADHHDPSVGRGPMFAWALSQSNSADALLSNGGHRNTSSLPGPSNQPHNPLGSSEDYLEPVDHQHFIRSSSPSTGYQWYSPCSSSGRCQCDKREPFSANILLPIKLPVPGWTALASRSGCCRWSTGPVCNPTDIKTNFIPWWAVIQYLSFPYGLADLVDGLKMAQNDPIWIQAVRAGTILVGKVEDLLKGLYSDAAGSEVTGHRMPKALWDAWAEDVAWGFNQMVRLLEGNEDLIEPILCPPVPQAVARGLDYNSRYVGNSHHGDMNANPRHIEPLASTASNPAPQAHQNRKRQSDTYQDPPDPKRAKVAPDNGENVELDVIVLGGQR